MGCMPASDVAPLPRLGEVFFDVRGNSRTMRLSWYADTGVAVFSIWQGGTCTGTFRVPIADLPRLVDALQRGPQGASRGGGELPSTGASPVQRHDEAARIADDPLASAIADAAYPPPGRHADPPPGRHADPGRRDPAGYPQAEPAVYGGHAEPPGYGSGPTYSGHAEPSGYGSGPTYSGHADLPAHSGHADLPGYGADPRGYGSTHSATPGYGSHTETPSYASPTETPSYSRHTETPAYGSRSSAGGYSGLMDAAVPEGTGYPEPYQDYGGYPDPAAQHGAAGYGSYPDTGGAREYPETGGARESAGRGGSHRRPRGGAASGDPVSYGHGFPAESVGSGVPEHTALLPPDLTQRTQGDRRHAAPGTRYDEDGPESDRYGYPPAGDR